MPDLVRGAEVFCGTMMLPDVATLRLCSMLASSAFALVFVAFAVGRRAETYWRHWAASSFLYVVALAGFGVFRDVAVCALLYGVLGLTTMLCLSGVRCIEGQPAFRPWMLALTVACGAAYAAPALLRGLAPALGVGAWETMTGTVALAVTMAAAGIALVFGRGSVPTRGRRIAGCALLGYLPGYTAAILSEARGAPSVGPDMTALLAMLLDQFLLSILNLGLLAMHGERAHAALRDLALRDPLTGALNRAGLDAAGVAPGTAVVLIDVDHFKAINDRQGHAAGDAVLVALVAAAQALLPGPRDAVVRLGGDEFAVLLHGADPAAAHAFAQALRRAVRRVAGTARFTVSLGLARVEAGEARLAPALARADGALYGAKAAGRDRAAA